MTDELLWEQFHAATLPKAEWTHAAHLRMAWLFLRRYAVDEAHLLSPRRSARRRRSANRASCFVAPDLALLP